MGIVIKIKSRKCITRLARVCNKNLNLLPEVMKLNSTRQRQVGQVKFVEEFYLNIRLL